MNLKQLILERAGIDTSTKIINEAQVVEIQTDGLTGKVTGIDGVTTQQLLPATKLALEELKKQGKIKSGVIYKITPNALDPKRAGVEITSFGNKV